MTICGRKITTLPTPAITPSVSRLRTQLSGNTLPTHPLSAETPASIASIGAVAQANTAWKMKNRTSARMTGPAILCSTTLSIPRVSRFITGSARIASRAMSRASRCSCLRSTSGAGAEDFIQASDAITSSSRFSSASRPLERVARVVTTGTPSRRSRAATSIRTPSRSARSYMFSASSIGRPSARTCRMKCSCVRMSPASIRTSRPSGAGSSALRPMIVSTEMRSSSERVVRP